MGHYRRQISVFTLFCFLLAILPAQVMALSIGDAATWVRSFPERFFRRLIPPKEKIESPEELEKIFAQTKSKTFDGNGAQRDEKSSILRPAKQVGLAVMDGQIKIIKQFASFQAAKLVTDFGKAAMATGAFATAGQVLRRMGAETAKKINGGLMKSGFGRDLFRHLAATGGAKSFLLKETNFALMAFIAVFVSSGIYDGLDVDTFKDRVIAVSPYMSSHTTATNLGGTIAAGFAARHLYAAFGGSFNRFYERALSSKATWGSVLRNLDGKTAALGERLFRAAKNGGQGQGSRIAEKMGLVGVGEGVALSLKGLTGRLLIGSAFALGGEIVVEGATALARGMPDRVMLGGNRNKLFVQQDSNWWEYQKTGKGLKDWWEQRRILLRELVHQRIKFPLKYLTFPITTMLGGYIGSVIAGMLFVGGGFVPMIGGTLVSTLFAGVGAWLGRWLATKADRGKFMMTKRREGYVRRIKKEVRQMPVYQEGRMNSARLEEIAQARALDFEKLEKVGQVSVRLLIVDDFKNVRLGMKNDYVYMVVDDVHGSQHFKKADNRFDVLDLDGNRLVYDRLTRAMFDVGKVARNSGRKITFVPGQPNVEKDHLTNEEEGNLHVFSNGLILEKRDDEWIVRGQGAADDIFFRETGARFTWDGAKRLFLRAEGPNETLASSTPTSSSTTDPLLPYADLLTQTRTNDLAHRVLKRSVSIVESHQQRLFKHIDTFENLERLNAFISKVEQHLGITGISSQFNELNDLEKGQHFLKRRIEGFVGKMGRQLGLAFLKTEPEEIEAGWHMVQDLHPVGNSNSLYETLKDRLARAPIWGPLSVLSDPETLLAFALIKE